MFTSGLLGQPASSFHKITQDWKSSLRTTVQLTASEHRLYGLAVICHLLPFPNSKCGCSLTIYHFKNVYTSSFHPCRSYKMRQNRQKRDVEIQRYKHFILHSFILCWTTAVQLNEMVNFAVHFSTFGEEGRFLNDYFYVCVVLQHCSSTGGDVTLVQASVTLAPVGSCLAHTAL